jgi:hypothetical protein
MRNFIKAIRWASAHPLMGKVFLLTWLTLLFAVATLFLIFGPGLLIAVILAWATPFTMYETIFWPFLMFGLTLFLCFRWRNNIKDEADLVRRVGAEHALWYELDVSSVPKGALRRVVMNGWDNFFPWFCDVITSSLGSKALPFVESVKGDMESYASITWSNFVLGIEKLVVSDSIGLTSLLLLSIWWSLRPFWTASRRILQLSYYFCVIGLWVMLLDSNGVRLLLSGMAKFFVLVARGEFWSWVAWRLTNLVVQFSVFALDVQFVGLKFSSHKLDRAGSTRKFATVLREMTMQFAVVVTDLGLPHYIRGTRAPTQQGIQESLDLLKEAGWPVNVNLAEPDMGPVRPEWKEWLIGGTDWAQGIHNLKMHTDHLLDKLRIQAVEYRRTEEYGSFDNELESTSRYFKSPRYDFPDLALDDVWFMVKDTFVHSRLTPFNHIINMWEKKYGLGAFMRRPGSKSKYRRSDFIKAIGGFRPFKALWRRTFALAGNIVPVSAVSIKGEALPPKKWAADKVRTIIGTPLVHYIMSTVWNYEPNHRFAWVTTPTKIGMPLNGYWLADLYHRHSRCQHHFAGDMSAFDSTISGKVIDLIKEVRKKGFESHKDYDRIATLIDVGYEQIQHQLLNTTSNGNIYAKGTGLTTGHSSTSSDNSLGTLILYLMAWKDLTGLGAREFKHFNELSDYGDDHVLSFLATKPAAWNFSNIQKAMAKWGVTNRLEASGALDAIPFLSKWSRKVNNADRAFFNSHKLAVPKRIVYHDREKLVGKMVAKIKNFDPKYRAKRLLSYLDLTAHHEDIYDAIHTILTRSSTMKRAMKNMGRSVPSYSSIVGKWYHKSDHSVIDVFDEDSAELQKAGKVFHYGQVDWIDTFGGMLAMLPDVLNPAIFNYGYGKALQLQLRSWLEWPVALMHAQNGFCSMAELVGGFRRTAYESIDPTIHSLSDVAYDPSSLLLRHWLFCWYKSWVQRPGRFGILEAVSKKINTLQFLLNAKINVDFGQPSLFLLDLAVICLLNFVPLLSYASWVSTIVFPRIDLAIEMVYQFLLVFIWSSVPPNYRDVTHFIRTLNEIQGPILVQAPTGTGKTTTFIKHLSIIAGPYWNKIIVIEPRSVVVKGVVPYVIDQLALDATGRTMGMDFDKRKKVHYVTPQEACLHWKETFDPSNLIVLDECHIEEPFYKLVVDYLDQSNVPSILLTATPSDRINKVARVTVPLTIASLWKVTNQTFIKDFDNAQAYLAAYRSWVKDQVQNTWSRSKCLVFYPYVEGVESFGESIGRRVSYLNSKSADSSGDVIITTSVADAGITIPDVDLVLSPSIDFYGTVHQGGRPQLANVGKIVLAQRRGRTGRTNNGAFRVLKWANSTLPDASDVLSSSKVLVSSWLALGLSPKVIQQFEESHLREVLSANSDMEMSDDIYQSLVNNLHIFSKNLEFLRASRAILQGKSVVGRDSFVYDYTAAGQFAETSNIPLSTIDEWALRAAGLCTSLQHGLEVDTVVLSDTMKSLKQVPATHTPFYNLMPDLTGLVDDPDYDFNEVKAIGVPKTLMDP